MPEGIRKITAEDVKRVMEMRKEEMVTNRTSPDLRKYLASHDWYVQNPLWFNMTFFVGSKYEMVHQGDMNLEMLRGIKQRIKQANENVYIFGEHNDYKPMCGPWDGTALRFDKGMAKPLGNEDIPLNRADIVLQPRGIATLNYDLWIPDACKKWLEEAGWNVELRPYSRD